MGKYIEYRLHNAKKQYTCDKCGKLIVKGEQYIKMKVCNSIYGKLIVKYMHFDCRSFNRTEEETNVTL